MLEHNRESFLLSVCIYRVMDACGKFWEHKVQPRTTLASWVNNGPHIYFANNVPSFHFSWSWNEINGKVLSKSGRMRFATFFSGLALREWANRWHEQICDYVTIIRYVIVLMFLHLKWWFPFRLIREIIGEFKNKIRSFLLWELGVLFIISHSLDQLEFGEE